MSYPLKDIGDRLAALEALQLSNRLAVLEGSQVSNTTRVAILEDYKATNTLQTSQLSNRLAVVEASQSGGGGSGEFAAFALTGNFLGAQKPYVFFYISQETTTIMFPPYIIFVSPLYTLYIKRENGPWYSFVGRKESYESGEAIAAIGATAGASFSGNNFTYYFTKN